MAGFLLPSQVAVRFHHDVHGRSVVNIFLFCYYLIFVCDQVGCVLGYIIGVSDVRRLFACWRRSMGEHLIVRVLEVSFFCAFDVY